MADPAIPTVPDAAGVPPVNRAPGSTAAGVAAVSSDALTVSAARDEWAIHYADGSPVFLDDQQAPTAWRSQDDSNDRNVPDYPLEDGGFESFNKTQRPREVKLTLMKQGTVTERATFRAIVERMLNSLELYSIITPGFTFKNMNLVHVDQSRSSETGADLLRLNLAFKEIRTSVQIAYSQVADPSGAANVNGGAVQALTPAASEIPGVSPQ